MSALERPGEHLALSYQTGSRRAAFLQEDEPTTYVSEAFLLIGGDVHLVADGKWDPRLVLTRDGSGWYDAFLEVAAHDLSLAPWRDGLDGGKRFRLYDRDGRLLHQGRHFGPLVLAGDTLETARPDPESGAPVRYPFARLAEDGWHLVPDWGGQGPGALVLSAQLAQVSVPRSLLAPPSVPAPGRRQRLSPLAERMCDTLLP